MLRALPLAALLLLALALALGIFSRDSGRRPATMVGQRIAPFDVPALDSDRRFSPETWKNKVVVLNIFASWCLPCAAEHGALMELAQSGKVEMMGLAWKDKPESVREWLRKRGNPYRMVGVDGKGGATVALGLTGVPETFVIDRAGTVRYHTRSALTPEAVEEIIGLVEKLDNE